MWKKGVETSSLGGVEKIFMELITLELDLEKKYEFTRRKDRQEHYSQRVQHVLKNGNAGIQKILLN